MKAQRIDDKNGLIILIVISANVEEIKECRNEKSGYSRLVNRITAPTQSSSRSIWIVCTWSA